MRRIAAVVLIWLCGVAAVRAEDEWRQASEGIADVRCVAVDKSDQKIIYIGSGKRVFKSKDGGENWSALAGFKAQVNHLALQGNLLFAATDDGAFRSDSKGEGWSWRRVFRGRDSLENKCYSLVLGVEKIYLVSAGGIFSSLDRGSSWQKEDGLLPAAQRKTESAEDSREQDGLGSRALAAAPGIPCRLFYGDNNGVLESGDYGKFWQPLSEYGLLNRNITFLYYSEGRGLYAVTPSGIFNYRDGRWHEVSLGLAASSINSVTEDGPGRLYAATDKGLYISGDRGILGASGNPERLIQGEPAIAQIQEAAIKYAEVEPEKIIKWRKLAAKKAILPQVSIGANNNITDVWHWETGSTAKGDDDTLRRGKSIIEWDVSLSWDLADIIWSEAQTAIDVRSKLMVELREDILDQVNKYYFERLRVKSELEGLGLEDRKRRRDKEIRLLELTAGLDALTGGFFSRGKTLAIRH